MKRIIDGLVYNTETADEIADFYTPGLGQGDFRYYEETLYQTKKGRYFLYRSGGPLTHMAVTVGNGSSGSSDIVPLDNEDVIRWLSENNYVDKLEELFPNAVEEA